MKAPAAALLAMAASFAVAPSSASAQPAPQAAASDTEKVKQVIVYGNDPCPMSDSGEILVCARPPDGDRYRIPKELRTDPNDPRVQSWANRAQSIEYVGRSGTESCSPVGGGGFTGCFAQLAKAAKEERKAMLGSASWADLVAKERQKRLSTIDAESEQIEARVKAEEAAKPPAEPGK